MTINSNVGYKDKVGQKIQIFRQKKLAFSRPTAKARGHGQGQTSGLRAKARATKQVK